MPVTPESQAPTRAFARVIGPYLVIVTVSISVRKPQISAFVPALFENPALVWFTGALLILAGLVIIAHHQYWSSLAAVLISLLGWFLALRGLLLLAAPQLMVRAAEEAMTMMPVVWLAFGVFLLIGLGLTYVGWFEREPG